MSGQTNFIQIHKLLDNINVLLRQLFLRRWKQENKSNWSSTLSVKPFVNGIGNKVFQKAGKIQREAISAGDVDRWDTTLLTEILLLSQFRAISMNGTKNKQERYMLEEIKKVRNTLCHQGNTNIEEELFKDLWARAMPVFEFFGGSADELNQEVTVNGTSECSDNIRRAEELKEDGNTAYKNEKPSIAVELYTEAISLSGLRVSTLAILYSNRSAAYLALSRVDERCIEKEYIYLALQDAKEAVNLNRTWYRGYFRVGNAYVALEKFDEALEYFDSALGFSPARPELISARDNCRMKQGQSRRREHLDPARMPSTEQETLSSLKTRHGIKGDAAKKVLAETPKIIDEIFPGASQVQQAHKLQLSGDCKLAATLYSKAASLGNADGIYNLGLLYKDGKGVSQDFKLYIKLMRQAAAQPHMVRGTFPNVGVAEAEHSLGLAYEEGVGVNEDCVEAAIWYKKASDHGCHCGSNNLAFLYMSGRGVTLDPQKGIQYWKLAASQGNILAMHSLAGHYLEVEQDPVQAREWFNRAVKHGNLDAQIHASEFEQKLKTVEKTHQETEAMLREFETKAGFNSQGLSKQERMENMLSATNPDVTGIMKNMKKLYSDCNKKSSSPLGARHHNFDYKQLKKSARNGSKTAGKLVLTMEHFTRGATLLMNWDGCYSHTVLPQLIHEFAECYRLEEIVVQLPMYLRDELCNIIDLVLENLDPEQHSVLDMEARICYAFLNTNNLKQAIHFAKCSKLKYPEELAFHVLYTNLLGFVNKNQEGLKEADNSLTLFQNNVELLYAKAVHTRIGAEKKRDGIILAYENFLTVAAADHRKVPESFYAIAREHFFIYACKAVNVENPIARSRKNFKKNVPNSEDLSWIPKVEEFYRKGLEAERVQLSCFIPYDSSQKELLEQVTLPMIQQLRAKESGKIPNEAVKAVVPDGLQMVPQSQSKRSFEKLTDITRVIQIKAHREMQAQCRSMVGMGKGYDKVGFTTAPNSLQKAPKQLAGLKPIKFSAMDTWEDKVYDGHVLLVTSIEDASGLGVLPSIRLALEDDNGDVMRAFIYNFSGKDKKTVQEKLGFGAKFSILNPYMRLASDGKFGIRVDDVASLIFHSPGGVEHKCRFCGFENANSRCGRCRVASYCDATCQQHDWKILKHKLVCHGP